ncbi:uncharacterized protein LOC134218089 [Armigeres subalbatus]|uniref:uncharacterized protein LOC134218089 n=1 Tax=Armigeres subalbatus TaxID=124917 RepID=UPI002ED04173
MAPVDHNLQAVDDSFDMVQHDSTATTSENNSLDQLNMLTKDNDQYIKLRNPVGDGLPYSAKFRYENTHWKLHGEQSLITIGSHYLAQATVEPLATLNDTNDFETAKELLLRNVKTVKVLVDNIQSEKCDLETSIRQELTELGADCARCSISGESLFKISRLARDYCYDFGSDFCKEMCLIETLGKKLKVTFALYSAMETMLQNRNDFHKDTKRLQDRAQEKKSLEEFFKSLEVTHKNMLIESSSSSMKSELENFESDHCLLLRAADIIFFRNLECLAEGTFLEGSLPLIVKNLFQRIETIIGLQSLPVTNEIFLNVFKSLKEVSSYVDKKFNTQNCFHYEENQFKIMEFPEDLVKYPMDRCMMHQLLMLINFANHFAPGKQTIHTNYPYTFRIDVFKNFTFARVDQHTWACLMDATVFNIFDEDFERIKDFSTVLMAFLEFISSDNQSSESHESCRIITHSILSFVAEVKHFGQDKQGKVILRSFMEQVFKEKQMDVDLLPELMGLFKNTVTYWTKWGENIPFKLIGQYFEPNIDALRQDLLDILMNMLDKNISLDGLIRFFRAFNELLVDLTELDYDWYVRVRNEKIRKTLLEKQAIESVRNKLCRTEDQCFLVAKNKYDEFIEICADEVIPKHYQVETIKTMLNYIVSAMETRRWNDRSTLTENDQLDVTILLINAMRRSLLYFKEQPDYADFMQFFKETTKPFKSIIKGCNSMSGFTRRIAYINQSFWYVRNQTSIGIDKALQLFSAQNSNFNEKHLRKALMVYGTQFEKHMRDCSDLENVDKIKRIVHDIKDRIKPYHTSSWTAEFKRNTIPVILAGVGAVWSILISEDVACSGKYVKPHTIQILGVLRLLCVDKNVNGVEKHLAQILTGQGKSLILGLVASILALFGHTVEIVCYSEYLAVRDATNFGVLYDALSIKSKVLYEVFDDMANDQVQKFSNKAWKYVSNCIGITHPVSEIDDQESTDLSNTVLLIDEFDVFFVDKFYGNNSYNVFAPEVNGLGKVQQKIWELVLSDSEDVECQIESFIDSSSEQDVLELKSLIERPGSYKLVTISKESASEAEYTNKTFFHSHFKQMIKTANEVHRLQNKDYLNNFKLNSNGVITCRFVDGEFYPNAFCQYVNAFTYFKLRKDNFVQNVNGSINFGYLYLDFSSLSYAKLPEKYPLILGVSGTLTGLSPYEKDAIENHYSILEKSYIPSYFGHSNLKFNPQDNFLCLPGTMEWRNTIISRVNAIINANRSVIVFFSNQFELDLFSVAFGKQLDRMNELTVETDGGKRERYIAEAGVPRTVTLATREMGRGVDYKSSFSVEKYGGVHVIQTFFSTDDKEETQIMGRTARMDNQGSYEMIVCLCHLVALGLVDYTAKCDEVCYDQLVEARRKYSKLASEGRAGDLMRANDKHDKIMEFYENI